MAKGKSFAEKMLRTKKGKDETENFKVIEAKTTPKGTVRYETRMVKVKKSDNEQKALGL
ncbi:hypothetical protein HQ587_08360 [bacterium]|nr:hypothetical protein [bacterium]